MKTYKLFIVLNNKTLVFDDVSEKNIVNLKKWLERDINFKESFNFKYNTKSYVINRNSVQYIEFETMKSFEERRNV